MTTIEEVKNKIETTISNNSCEFIGELYINARDPKEIVISDRDLYIMATSIKFLGNAWMDIYAGTAKVGTINLERLTRRVNKA